MSLKTRRAELTARIENACPKQAQAIYASDYSQVTKNACMESLAEKKQDALFELECMFDEAGTRHM